MGRARTWTRAAVVLLAVAGGVIAGTGPGEAAPPPLAWNTPKPLTVTATGTNGESRAMGDGLACDGDSPVGDVHLGLSAPVAAGKLSSLAGTLTANLGLAGRRLEPTTSHVTLGDDRGTVQLQLNGGTCPPAGLGNNLSPGGNGLVGNGSASLLGGTGSYRDIKLTGGTWNLSTATDPGADNPWSLTLGGQLTALAPGFTVETLATYWANLGLDYVSRIVTVQYRVTNPGPGDSYGSTVNTLGAGPVTGVTNLGPTTVALGDLLAGESRTFTVRYQLALTGPPCQLVVLGCTFVSSMTASFPDALDVPWTRLQGFTITAPNLPPPL